jgi:N-acyl-phosphatidylethanolamine-hydrolysing phospholipase D
MNSRITFINHASVLIQLDGTAILTDPIYTRSVGWIAPRMQRPGILIENLPRIDVILLSHNDYDHLSMRTLRKLRRRNQSAVFVPSGDAKYARKAGYTDVHEMNHWDACELGGLQITCVPARHKSNRMPLQRTKKLCCGYVVQKDDKAVYFAGDTGYGEHFKEIASHFSLDVALLPIGAYKPYEWFREIHLNPQTAVQAFIDLKAKLFVPIHWGTFKISDEPLHEPPVLLLVEAGKRGIAGDICVLQNGGIVEL